MAGAIVSVEGCILLLKNPFVLVDGMRGKGRLSMCLVPREFKILPIEAILNCFMMSNLPFSSYVKLPGHPVSTPMAISATVVQAMSAGSISNTTPHTLIRA